MEKAVGSKKFLIGLVAGVLITLGVMVIGRAIRSSSGEGVLAEMQGEKLTRQELRKTIASSLIPFENDEYQILQQGVDNWLQSRLLEKEAKAQGITLDELYRKEIWSRVQVSVEIALSHYSKNRELYGSQSFEQVSSQISQGLRNKEYARVKEEYLKGLQQKYRAKVLLKRPASFVEGLAIPSSLPNVPSLLQPAGPAPAPSLPPTFPTQPAPVKLGVGTGPSRGPQNAPITILEFADFHCHFCKQVAPTLEQVFKNYPGKVRWVFHHFPLSKTPGTGSFVTHEAATCANEQGKFWEFHDALFALSGIPQASDIQSVATNIGLDSNRFQACLQSKRYQSEIQQSIAEGERRGVQGTPTIFVNDQAVNGAYPYDYFVGLIEGILNPGKAPTPSPAVPTPPPAPRGNVQFDDLKDRPSLGPDSAPVTIVEFSDFYCPFCKRVGPTLEQLTKNYPGKIRRVWRHYPLAFHTGADRAHEASECAHEQDKFWEYHDKLFANQGAPMDEAALTRFADEIGLNKKKFGKCLTSGKYKDLIQKEIAKGNQVGVRGTPAMFVNGQLVSGAQPYESFDSIVKSQLSKS